MRLITLTYKAGSRSVWTSKGKDAWLISASKEVSAFIASSVLSPQNMVNGRNSGWGEGTFRLPYPARAQVLGIEATTVGDRISACTTKPELELPQAHAITMHISYNFFSYNTVWLWCLLIVCVVPLKLLNFTTMNLLVNTQVMHGPTSKGTTDSERSSCIYWNWIYWCRYVSWPRTT